MSRPATYGRCGWTVVLISFLLASVLPMSRAFAQVPQLIRYQGQAVDNQGVPLEGPYTLTFRLYDAATAGTIVWQEQQSVTLSKGHFSVLLGQQNPLTSVDWSQPRWISIQVGTQPELAPRQQFTSVPLALRAQVAEGLTTPVSTSTITDDANKLVPTGAVILWTGSACPAGYARLTTLDGKFVVSGGTFNANAGGQDNVTVATSPAGSHAHSISGTTSPASGPSHGWSASKGTGSDPTDAAELQHTHSGGSLTASNVGDHGHTVSLDNRPAFATVLLCQKN